MYRTKLEKIEHDSESFRPVRLGFWYWNTLNNRMIDTELINLNEQDMIPHFFGNDEGYMEMYYGQTCELLITDASNTPLRNTEITVETVGSTTKLRTDNIGKLKPDLLTVRYLRDKGVNRFTNYQSYTFRVEGYRAYTISVAQLKTATTLKMER
jgi:hypothetical protein